MSVSARKGEGYFMAMQTIALLSVLPVMSPDLPHSFPKYTFQGLLMTSHAVRTLPSAALIPLSQGMGLLERWSEKVLFFCIQYPLCLPLKPSFFMFWSLSECAIQKIAPVPTMDAAQDVILKCNNNVMM